MPRETKLRYLVIIQLLCNLIQSHTGNLLRVKPLCLKVEKLLLHFLVFFGLGFSQCLFCLLEGSIRVDH